jgi:hypothetical protein
MLQFGAGAGKGLHRLPADSFAYRFVFGVSPAKIMALSRRDSTIVARHEVPRFGKHPSFGRALARLSAAPHFRHRLCL